MNLNLSVQQSKLQSGSVSFGGKRVFTIQQPNKRRIIYPNKRNITCSLSSNDYIHMVSNSVVYFTMFYCTMNWYRYRAIRKQYEDNINNDKKKRK